MEFSNVSWTAFGQYFGIYHSLVTATAINESDPEILREKLWAGDGELFQYFYVHIHAFNYTQKKH